MGWVDRHLAPEERVVLRTRLHPVVFAGTVAFAAFVLGAVGLIVRRNELSGRTIAILWLCGGAIAAAAFISPLLRWWGSEFAVTTRRLLVKVGVFSPRTIEVRLPSPEAVEVELTVAGRLLGYGTLHVADAEGGVEAFARVARAEDVLEAARRPPGPGASRGR